MKFADNPELHSRYSALDLWSLATEGTQEFGLNINREFAARTCSLATEGTQEFPPLKGTYNFSIIASVFAPDILSHRDNASYKLASLDAAKLQIRQNYGE